jgi:hypothetical protein
MEEEPGVHCAKGWFSKELQVRQAEVEGQVQRWCHLEVHWLLEDQAKD